MFVRLKNVFLKHKQHLPTAALVVGFIWDFFTLGRPDQLFDNAVLLFYLLLAGAGILALARARERDERAPLYLLVIIQFAFGNLTSALFVFYSISGTLAGNWLFFLVLIGLLVGNEFFRDRYGLLRFNISIYYLLVLAWAVLIVPVLLREIGAGIFIISSLTSVVLIALFLLLVRLLAPTAFSQQKNQFFIAVAGILISFNILYFFNVIPPVPLALKEVGIYHSVERQGNMYRVSYEKPEWYEFFKRSDTTFHFTSGTSVYCFSSVFAPAELTTPIFHRWEHYDNTTERWESVTRISFPLVGGRDEGFRGFSVKSALVSGKWRCNVETKRGTLIGRRSFEIIENNSAPKLVFDTR